MIEEFPDREPVWGWRDDSPAVMERQIDLAADSGLAFFAFCWYWHDDGQPKARLLHSERPAFSSPLDKSEPNASNSGLSPPA